MTIVFPLLQLFALIACLPAYRYAGKRHHEPVWSLFLVAPCMVLWVVLTMFGVGAQSLSNMIELFDLMLGTIILYYLRVFVLERASANPTRNNRLIVAVTVLAAVLLRRRRDSISVL